MIASSEARMMVGRISRARVSDPASTLLECDTCRVLMKKARPKRPKTMLGTPARVLMHVRSRLTSRPSRGVFAQVDGGDHAQGYGEQHGPEGQVERAEHLGPDAAEEMGVERLVNQKAPVEREARLQHVLRGSVRT